MGRHRPDESGCVHWDYEDEWPDCDCPCTSRCTGASCKPPRKVKVDRCQRCRGSLKAGMGQKSDGYLCGTCLHATDSSLTA